ncbi:MAG: hypothetical protein MJY63_05425 [Paludibacteraceae bacterium]|nr:hypothetical protein [Paludibacteraceae bacterium]
MQSTGSGNYTRNDLYPLLTKSGESVVYNMTLTYKEMSMNGFMVASMEEDESIHVVCTAFMGMTLFDFTIKDHGFDVNSCMEQLDRPTIKHILKKDLVTLFTRNVDSTFRAKRYKEPAKTNLGYKIRTATGKAHYLIDNENRRVNHVSLSGGPLRAEFTYSNEAILIAHPRLGLELTLYQ